MRDLTCFLWSVRIPTPLRRVRGICEPTHELHASICLDTFEPARHTGCTMTPAEKGKSAALHNLGLTLSRPAVLTPQVNPYKRRSMRKAWDAAYAEHYAAGLARLESAAANLATIHDWMDTAAYNYVNAADGTIDEGRFFRALRAEFPHESSPGPAFYSWSGWES
jgi:hypothetical protein